MSELKKHIKTEIGSERWFGIVFAAIFLGGGVYPLFKGEDMHLWFLAGAVVLLLISGFAPTILSGPNRLWFKFGMLLGAIVSPVVMTLIYFMVVVPTGVVVRIIGKDPLRLKIDKYTESYWVSRPQEDSSMKDQF